MELAKEESEESKGLDSIVMMPPTITRKTAFLVVTIYEWVEVPHHGLFTFFLAIAPPLLLSHVCCGVRMLACCGLQGGGPTLHGRHQQGH